MAKHIHVPRNNNSGSHIVQTLEHRIGSYLHYRTPKNKHQRKQVNKTRDAARNIEELVSH